MQFRTIVTMTCNGDEYRSVIKQTDGQSHTGAYINCSRCDKIHYPKVKHD